jgi:mono/diheme cytochrome c family protein
MKAFVFRFWALACVLVCCSLLSPAQDAASLYQKNCAGCHGVDGSGKTAARKKLAVPDFRDKTYVEMSDAEMFDTIGRGTKHKEYPHTFLLTGMNEQQVQGLVAHIRTLQKKAK